MPSYDPNKVHNLHILGMNLIDKHLTTVSLDAINLAIKYLQEALDLTPPGTPTRETRLSSLANAYLHRYQRTAAVADINTAINLCREGISLTPDGHLLRAKQSKTLGDAYRFRYIQLGVIHDINQAIQKYREGLDLKVSDSITRINLTYSLGLGYQARYQETATLADLNRSNELLEEACNSTPEGTKFKNSRRKDLALGYQVKYLRTEQVVDIKNAISLFRERIDHSSSKDPGYASFHADLGVAYGAKQLKGGEMKDLEKSIQLLQDAVNLSGPSDPLYVWMLEELGKAYKNRFWETKSIPDIDTAIEKLQKAVEVSTNAFQHATQLQWLSRAAMDKFKETQSINDIDQSIQFMERSLNKTLPRDIPRGCRLYELGNRYCLKYKVTQAVKDYTAATKYLQEVVHDVSIDLYNKVLAGKEAMDLFASHKDWQKGFKIATALIELVPSLIPRFLEPLDTQYVLRDIAGIACDAAAMSLNAGREPLVALKLLEAGRDIMATSINDLRGEIISLKSEYPEIAEEFLTQRYALDKPVTDDSDPSRRYERGNRFSRLIDQIRELPDFDDFLRVPDEEALKRAAITYPIVVINVSRYRCDAIILSNGCICSMALPDLTLAKLQDQSPHRNSISNPEVLSWLWEVAMKPILDFLGFVKLSSTDGDCPRVCWIPTGPLCRYPLHAAGHHGVESSEAVIDRVMSSYSSSVKAIIDSRRPTVTRMGTTRARSMLISMEDTPGTTTLPFAGREVEMLHSLHLTMSLDPINAKSKQEVISKLPECSVFHFAGHGFTDRQDPSKSHLVLQDNGQSDPLEVGTLLSMNLRQSPPFLAYLSACGTGQIKNDTFFDESIHLISAFRLAGFRHVIGTLWEVNDEYCIDMARITYEEIRDGGMTDDSVCKGLHKASRELRRRCLGMAGSGSGRETKKDHVGSTEHSVQDQGQRMSERDILPCDEDLSMPLYWVPYVHFGV
jgi:tetratricopeptide (TPR) repeat protein